MGILLVYDVTDEQSFQNIRNWIRNIEQHAADNVDKILIGNKCDMMSEKLVETARGQALAEEYGQATIGSRGSAFDSSTFAFLHYLFILLLSLFFIRYQIL